VSLLVESNLRGLAQSRTTRAYDSMSGALDKSLKNAAESSSFDIFLSHSYLDKELIIGALTYLEKMGYSVYVDWKQDSQLKREDITKRTARILRRRISQSKALFFVTTANAPESKWMPWELGYMDGKSGKCAILPISEHYTASDSYFGQEYLEVYPYVVADNDKAGKNRLWVHEDAETYVNFDSWLEGKDPYKRG
jgi:hypothetical protein